MGLWRRWIAGALVALAALAAAPVSAWADGDPASDYLLANQVFLGAQPASTAATRSLISTVRAANRAGFGIRVALVPGEYDLGSITALWRRPQVYARFLGTELSLAYRQRLLVVMPNGFGFYWKGHSASAADSVLARTSSGAGPGAGLAAAAAVAVRRLAAVDGIRLSPSADHSSTASAARPAPAPAPASASASGRTGVPPLVVAALAAALAVALVVAVVVWRRVSPPLRRAPVVLGSVAVVALGVSFGVTRLVRPGSASTPSPASVVTPPAVSWAPGARPAPEFHLVDQAGRPASVAALRGRPVIVTFVDPLCRNLCPLEAQTLNHVVAQLPADRRPTILAVSVDVYADTRADLLQDFRRWQLVPQWHWAVGSPAALAAVWKRYEIGVRVVTRKVAGTTIHSILHTEAAYLIDASGNERALFVWPFYPADVEHELAKIA